MQKWLPLLLLATLSVSVEAAEQILVQSPAVIAPGAPIPAAIQRECGLPLFLGNYTFQAVNELDGGAKQVANISEAGDKQFLELTILAVHGTGGGGWSGSKSMSINVSLIKNGVTLESTILQRSSKGNMFSGTCSIMGKIAKVLGKDVARWVEKTSEAKKPS